MTTNYKSYTNDTDSYVDVLVADNLVLPGLNSNKLLALDRLRAARTVDIVNSNGADFKYSDGVITASLAQDLRPTAAPRFSWLRLPDFELCADKESGFFLREVATGAQPINVRQTDHPNGPAVILESKVIINNLGAGIEFPSSNGTIKITPGVVTGTQNWVIPEIDGPPTAFAALGGTQTFSGQKTFNTTTYFAHHLLPINSGTIDLGSSTRKWNKLYTTDIDTTSITVGGQPITPGSYVTTNTAQTITGKKLFTDDINIGTTQFGRLRFSTYNSGNSFIQGGYTTDADYFLEFYVRGVKAFEIRNGYPGSGRGREVTVPGLLRTGRIAPVSGKTHDIGSDAHPYRNLYLGNGTGIISLGHNIRGSGRAELHLHSIGDDYSWIFFGKDARTDANSKWVLGSSPSTQDDTFRLWRATGLSGGTFSEVIDVVGSGANAGQFKLYTATESTSTTTGSATFAGGVGIAKALHAGSVTAGSYNITGAPDKRLLLTSSSSLGWSNSTFADTTSSTVLGSDAGYHQPAVPDPTGFDTYMANSNTVYGATAGYTTIKATSRNAYFGERAGVGIGHNYNTAMGYRALDTGTAPGGPTCNNNTVVGAFAMNKTSTGEAKVSYNTAVGVTALRELSLGSRNTAVGSGTGQSMTESFDCVFIGYQAGLASLNGNNRIAIGSMAAVGQDNWCQIGSTGSPMTLTLGMYDGGRIGTPEQPINEINATKINVSTMSLPQTTIVTPHNMRFHMTESKTGVSWTLLPSGTYTSSGTASFIFARSCNTVTLTCTGLPFSIGTGNPKSLRLTEFIPAGYRPVTIFKFPVFLQVAGYYPAQGVCTIDELGTIQIDIIFNAFDMPRDHFFGDFNEVCGFSFSYNIYPYMAGG